MIAHVLEGDVRKHQLSVAREISRRFGLKNVNQKIMPHVTLKIPFEAEENRSVEDTVCDVLDTSSAFSYDTYHFGHFGDDVVYLDICGDEHLRTIAIDLNNALYERNGFEIGLFEGEHAHFHSTLAYTNSENFEKVWDYVQRLPKPLFEKKARTISILRRDIEDKTWDVYKHYRID